MRFLLESYRDWRFRRKFPRLYRAFVEGGGKVSLKSDREAAVEKIAMQDLSGGGKSFLGHDVSFVRDQIREEQKRAMERVLNRVGVQDKHGCWLVEYYRFEPADLDALLDGDE